MKDFYPSIINPFDPVDFYYQDFVPDEEAMGRSKAWTPHEKKVVSAAFIAASETGSSMTGKHQKSEVLWAKVFEELKERAPPYPACDDRYHNRGITAIKSHWTDSIRFECLKFNKALNVVFAAHPTGCTTQNKINMAVAIFLGKTGRMEYQFKEFNPNEWKNYEAWKVLRAHRKFLPPALAGSASAGGEEEDEEDEEEEEEAATLSASTGAMPPAGTLNITDPQDIVWNETVLPGGFDASAGASAGTPSAGSRNSDHHRFNSAPAPSIPAPTIPREISGLSTGGTSASSTKKNTKSRGAPKGRTGTKAAAALEEHRRKKMKTLADLASIQKKRHESNDRFQSFQMLKWKMDCATDQEEKKALSASMSAILSTTGVLDEPTMGQPPSDYEGSSDNLDIYN